MNRLFRLILRTSLLWAGSLLADVEVATLHPLVAEIAHKVGGKHATVYELIGSRDNPHDFDPSPQLFAQASEVDLVLISGKGLESSFIDQLEDNFGEARVFAVGDSAYSLNVSTATVFSGSNDEKHEGHSGHQHLHHEDHDHPDAVDPHWWHDPDNMRRAAFAVAIEFSRIDPDNADFYQQEALAYAQELRQLKSWIRSQVDTIPPANRVLATSHLAYGYFCHAFDFQAIAIQGYNREDIASPKELGELISFLKENEVTVLFPEVDNNPKALESISRETGLRIGGELNSDGTDLSPNYGYIEMMRSNVGAIVEAINNPSK